MTQPCLPSRQHGLTLIEMIVFIIVVSIGLAGILTVLDVTGRSSADPVIRKQALAVAEAMLDEVLSKSFQNDPAGNNAATPALGCTPTTVPRCLVNTVTDRQNYNDVDDFNGWNQVGVFRIDGTSVPGLGNLTVSVGVTALTLGGLAGKQVTVTVSGGTETVTLSGFRANL